MCGVATSTKARLLSDRELRAWRGLLRTHAVLERRLDGELEATHGLGITSYEVLMYLGDAPDGRLRMHDLAEKVLLSRSGLTRLVDRLERSGFLRREACPQDARGAFAVLEPVGRAKLDAARGTHLEGVRRSFLSHLDAGEQDALGDLWARVLGDGEEL